MHSSKAYRTHDGQIFKTPNEAARHELIRLLDVLDPENTMICSKTSFASIMLKQLDFLQLRINAIAVSFDECEAEYQMDSASYDPTNDKEE